MKVAKTSRSPLTTFYFPRGHLSDRREPRDTRSTCEILGCACTLQTNCAVEQCKQCSGSIGENDGLFLPNGAGMEFIAALSSQDEGESAVPTRSASDKLVPTKEARLDNVRIDDPLHSVSGVVTPPYSLIESKLPSPNGHATTGVSTTSPTGLCSTPKRGSQANVACHAPASGYPSPGYDAHVRNQSPAKDSTADLFEEAGSPVSWPVPCATHIEACLADLPVAPLPTLGDTDYFGQSDRANVILSEQASISFPIIDFSTTLLRSYSQFEADAEGAKAVATQEFNHILHPGEQTCPLYNAGADLGPTLVGLDFLGSPVNNKYSPFDVETDTTKVNNGHQTPDIGAEACGASTFGGCLFDGIHVEQNPLVSAANNAHPKFDTSLYHTLGSPDVSGFAAEHRLSDQSSELYTRTSLEPNDFPCPFMKSLEAMARPQDSPRMEAEPRTWGGASFNTKSNNYNSTLTSTQASKQGYHDVNHNRSRSTVGIPISKTGDHIPTSDGESYPGGRDGLQRVDTPRRSRTPVSLTSPSQAPSRVVHAAKQGQSETPSRPLLRRRASATGPKKSWEQWEKDKVDEVMSTLIGQRRKTWTGKTWERACQILLQEHSVDRTWRAIKNEWSRYGRKRTGLDERNSPEGRKLVTGYESPSERKAKRQAKKAEEATRGPSMSTFCRANEGGEHEESKGPSTPTARSRHKDLPIKRARGEKGRRARPEAQTNPSVKRTSVPTAPKYTKMSSSFPSLTFESTHVPFVPLPNYHPHAYTQGYATGLNTPYAVTARNGLAQAMPAPYWQSLPPYGPYYPYAFPEARPAGLTYSVDHHGPRLEEILDEDEDSDVPAVRKRKRVHDQGEESDGHESGMTRKVRKSK